MAHFIFTSIADWPPLAWIARCDARTGEVAVLHGPRVETAEDWFCEAAWDGDYERGDFDATDIVAGSGGRRRDDAVTFVASGATVDRLHSFDAGNRIVCVSNSLPCLLASIGGEIDPTYKRYGPFFHSVVRGIDRYERWLRTSVGPVQLTYFDNLRWSDGVLTRVPKPCGARGFTDFASYHGFLERSMASITNNARSSKRAHPFRPLSTLSSGYDSTTVTVLARQAGLQDVISFSRGYAAPSLGKPTVLDSGAHVAQILGLTCHVSEAREQGALEEALFFAGDASAADVHYLGAARHLSGRLLFTGYQGDMVWGKTPRALSETIVRASPSGVSLSEFRLWAGFLHCPVPFWGIREIARIHAITNAAEMQPWDVEGPYSRPICRRIAEEAGLPRGTFATGKRASAAFPLWRRSFLGAAASEDYLGWLRAQRLRWLRSGRVPPPTSLRLDRGAMSAARLLEKATERVAWSVATRSGWSALPHYPVVKGLRTLTHPEYASAPWVPSLRRYVFAWALTHAIKRYAPVATSLRATAAERASTRHEFVGTTS